jgi:hypothetical protein
VSIVTAGVTASGRRRNASLEIMGSLPTRSTESTCNETFVPGLTKNDASLLLSGGPGVTDVRAGAISFGTSRARAREGGGGEGGGEPRTHGSRSRDVGCSSAGGGVRLRAPRGTVMMSHDFRRCARHTRRARFETPTAATASPSRWRRRPAAVAHPSRRRIPSLLANAPPSLRPMGRPGCGRRATSRRTILSPARSISSW